MWYITTRGIEIMFIYNYPTVDNYDRNICTQYYVAQQRTTDKVINELEIMQKYGTRDVNKID